MLAPDVFQGFKTGGSMILGGVAEIDPLEVVLIEAHLLSPACGSSLGLSAAGAHNKACSHPQMGLLELYFNHEARAAPIVILKIEKYLPGTSNIFRNAPHIWFATVAN